jgi:phosphatidylinositol alpha-mannosyltransferase
MRVCLVTPYDLSADGGVNRHTLGLAEALRRMGDDVSVLGPASGRRPPGTDGIGGAIPIPANGSVARIGLFTRAGAVRDYLERGRFDVVHVHEALVPGPSRLALRLAGVPVVGTFHASSENEGWLGRSLRRAASLPLERLGRAIAVSEPAARFLQKVYAGPVAIIPNGLDTAAFASGQQRSRARVDRPLSVLFVGRFGEPRKGLRYLLEAVALVRKQGCRLELTVAGEGPRACFEPLARRAGARFVGRLGDDELAASYREADVFCAPSIGGESFGLVLAEAMAAGCPVLASDLPGYAEAAAGAAMLVPRADPTALASALRRLEAEPLLRQRLHQRGLVRAAELDWRKVALRVRAVYGEALAPAARAGLTA